MRSRLLNFLAYPAANVSIQVCMTPVQLSGRRLFGCLSYGWGVSVAQRQAPNVGRVDGIECWEEADARTFNVRGQNYMRDRRKIPSQHAMYRCPLGPALAAR